MIPFSGLFYFLFVSISFANSENNSTTTKSKIRQEKNVTFVDFDEKESDDLIHKWNEQTISGIIAAIANQK